jgi:hypothetical protein
MNNKITPLSNGDFRVEPLEEVGKWMDERRVMAYKEKICPKCNSKHTKRGEFCSRSCGNSRPLTKEQKQKIGAAKSAWLTSGDEKAEAAIHSFTSLGNNKVADPVAPIVSRDIGHNRFVEDGDLWEEV